MLSSQLFKNGMMSDNFDDLLSSKSTLITEEYLHRKLINRHKIIMSVLIFFHLLLLSCIILGEMYSVSIQDESLSCNYSYEFKNYLYVTVNLIFLYIFYTFYRRPNSSLCNIFYYQNISKFILLLFIFSFLILIQLFVPQYFCKHKVHWNLEVISYFLHISIEIIFIKSYIKCLIEEFKTFSNFNK